MLNAAIIGLGWWGKRLVEAVEGSKLIRVSRAVTLEPELARDFAEARKLKLGTSYEEVLADPAVEAVVLATPHTTHRAMVEAAAVAGKHVCCEKPFALARTDAEAAIAACRRAGVVVGVGQNFRFMPSIKALRELVEAGTLGTIMHVEGNYSHDWIAGLTTDHWRNAREESRAGGMTGMGIHVLDCFSYLVGPMRRLAALSKRRVLDLPAGDTTAALIEFASGATGLLGTTLKTPFVWRVALYGENARAESVSETRLILHRGAGDPEVRDFPAVNHVGQNLESFAAAALGKGKFHIDEAGIIHTVAALEAVFRSAESGGAWQTVS
ncbi:MAG TPA: Gfo/Idh/MocA family oxidoreductase [Xanthobacteraceae bacterium]|nr:Gfo/Idh/MocA family oxidoreductase [Xanthobacteraceae bacterium]